MGGDPDGIDRDVSSATLEAEVTAMLDASADAWNAGDLDGYISYYADDATFAGSTGLVHGAETIRQRYAESYWASGSPEDALRFEVLEVRGTGPGSAMLFGRYILHDRTTEEATGTGYFTLVLRRLDGSWKIVHDHSSAEATG